MNQLWRILRFYALMYVAAPICDAFGSRWYFEPMMALRFEYEIADMERAETE